MTANEAENSIYVVDREIDNLQILLKTTILTMEELDKNDIMGLLQVAQRQCAALKSILEPTTTYLQQLRISESANHTKTTL